MECFLFLGCGCIPNPDSAFIIANANYPFPGRGEFHGRDLSWNSEQKRLLAA
jgi:hypothetical protein